MPLIFVEFHAHLDLSTVLRLVFLLGADSIRDWNQRQHVPFAASAMHHADAIRDTLIEFYTGTRSKLTVFVLLYFFLVLPEMKCLRAQMRPRMRCRRKVVQAACC